MRGRVVAGIDGSEASLAAAGFAGREAVSRGLPLCLVHVAPAQPPAPWVLEQARTVPAGVHPLLEVTGERLDGPVTEVLLECADDATDLLVVGTRGLGGFPGLSVGSVALELAGRSPRPVVLVPEHTAGAEAEHPPEVVLGIDARRPAKAALAFAFDAARRREARLRAVHAWSLPAPYGSPWATYAPTEEDRGEWEDEEVQLLSEALRDCRRDHPDVALLPDVRLFTPAKALVTASAYADLLVVGRSSPSLRGVPHPVVHHSRCPVALIPGA